MIEDGRLLVCFHGHVKSVFDVSFIYRQVNSDNYFSGRFNNFY